MPSALVIKVIREEIKIIQWLSVFCLRVSSSELYGCILGWAFWLFTRIFRKTWSKTQGLIYLIYLIYSRSLCVKFKLNLWFMKHWSEHFTFRLWNITHQQSEDKSQYFHCCLWNDKTKCTLTNKEPCCKWSLLSHLFLHHNGFLILAPHDIYTFLFFFL